MSLRAFQLAVQRYLFINWISLHLKRPKSVRVQRQVKELRGHSKALVVIVINRKKTKQEKRTCMIRGLTRQTHSFKHDLITQDNIYIVEQRVHIWSKTWHISSSKRWNIQQEKTTDYLNNLYHISTHSNKIVDFKEKKATVQTVKEKALTVMKLLPEAISAQVPVTAPSGVETLARLNPAWPKLKSLYPEPQWRNYGTLAERWWAGCDS